MIAVFINATAIFIGGLLGLLFRDKIKDSAATTIVSALGLVTIVVGVMGAMTTANLLCLIVCMAVGTIIGALLRIDERITAFGERIGTRLGAKLSRRSKKYGKFADGFVGSSLLFCVGAMAVVGSFKAGIEHDYSVLFTKSALDFIAAVIFTSAFGIGVPFSALSVLAFQGSLTALASVLSPFLSEAVVTELSAVRGTIIIGLGFNILSLSERKLKVADMTPAIFLPIVYLPLNEAVRNLIAN